MADRRVQFTLGVNVDSAKAKAQLSDLQRTLDKLTSTQKGGGLEHLPITKSIFDATASAKELQQYLREATNVKTGSLDLSILSKSLKDSGKTLKDYRLAFEELGPSGEAAFRKIASSIVQAEAPMKRTNKLIEDMKTSLSNTIKWQISSSAIHAFMGAIQGAYGYAKDLNQSLNNIRIVTGQSTEQMAKFAVEANKSAKALSTTTTEYTDAALIYYQQGLSEEQVKQRTDVTIKMANVARESAVTVSDQMTAVWNNFYDGSKSLEYYSDVMTALGAATASSTSEISAGLEKFAAVADTVGLSYEYATAALATVTSETRQSADVVGTAFRTLFTRIQGLQQGETADDGVNLNKYSQALANVGIQILDTNDQIKSMDTILNELGERWKTLGNEQKIALAQTVGGARQYTTLIALMDNWTSFQDNLTTAYGATGALQEQAEIYAESWEAAQEKVTAALEKIYSQLLNDEFFIGFSNALADGIDLISKLIDTLGGLPGVLGVTGLAFTTLFKDSLPEFINNSVRKLQDFTGVTLKNADLVRQDALKQNAFLTQNDITDKGLAEQARDSHYVERINQLKKASLDLDEAQIKKLRIKIELEKELASTVIEDAEKVDEAGEAYRNAKANANKVRKKVLGKDENDERYKKLKSTKFYKDDGSFNEKFKFTKTFAKKNGYSEDEIKELKKLAAAEFEVIKKLKEKKEAEYQLNEDNKKFSEIRKKELSDLLDLQDKGLDQTKYYTSVMEEGFIAAGEAIGATATAFASISSIVKTAGDDSLSSFEKIERIFPSLLVAVPSVVVAMKQGLLAIKLLNTEGLKGIQIKVAESILDAKAVDRIKERISWTAIYEELIKKETTTKSANIVVTKALEWANGSLLKTTVLLAGAFAAVVAVGWILIKLWESMKNNSPEEKLKKANEELERAKEEATEASSAYNSLKSSIDSLKSAQDTLSGLTKGTREWKEAVLAVNQQILDLIDKYPELAPFLNSDGEILSIDEEGFDTVLDNMMKRAETASLAVLQGEKEVAQLREQQSKTDEKRIGAVTKVGYKTGGSNEFIYNVNDKQSEEYEKYYSGIGATRTEYKSEMSIGEATDLYERIKKAGAFNEDGTINLEKAKAAEIDITEQQVKVIEKNMDAIIQHSAELEASTKQIKTYNKAIGDQWVKNNKNVPDHLKDAYGLGVGMLANSYMDTARENVGDLSGQELYNRYSLYSGMSIDEIKKKVAEDDSFTQAMLDAIINNEALSLASNEVDTRLKTIREDENGSYQKNLDFEGKQIIDQWIASGGDMSFIDALTDQELELIKPFFENLPSQIAEWFKDGADEAKNLIKDPNYSIQAKEKREERYNEKEKLLASQYGMDKAGLDAYQEDLEDRIPTLEEYVDVMGEYDELVLEITEDSLKWSKTGKKLGKTLEDLTDDLNSNDIDTYRAALKTLADEITAWTGIEIDSSVAEQLWSSGVLKDAIAGSEEAIETVYKKSIEYQASTWGLAENGAAQVVDFVNTTYDYIANKDIKIGAIDNSLFADGLNQLIIDSGLAVEQVEAILSSANMDATITTIDINDIVTNKTGEHVWTNPNNPEDQRIIPEETYNMVQSGKLTLPFVNNVKFKGIRSEFNFTPTSKSSGGGSKKDKKSSSKEIERYHVISNEIEEVQNELDKISTATERAFGADKLALIDAEIQKMKELKDAQDEYVRQIEENFEKDKQAIAAYGAVFDKDGTILNYEEIMQRQIDKFNASRTDAAEEEYQKFLDLLKQYEETNDLLDKERNESIKQAGELLDKELEDVEYRVNLQVEFNDDTIEYLEFLLEQLEDQAFSAAQSIDLLGRQVQENFDNIKSNSSGLAETLALAGFDSEVIDGVLAGDQAAINKVMSQKEIDNNIIESIKEYRDALMDSISNVRDLQKAIDEELINSLDEASEKFGELHDELNHNADILSSLQNIMDLTGESILGFTDDAKKAIEDAQLDTAVSQVATSYDKLTAAQEEYKKAVESDQSEEVIKAAAEKVKEAEEQLLSDWEAALEQATTNFEASIERSVAAFSNAVAGAYGGLDELQDAFDKQEELDDIYIEDYKKIYELTKLSRDISRSIDDSDNIKAKQALRDLQGEINELQKEGVELSEYDIEYLQKKYELRLAEIALEEAQNAKSTVRMTRDSEGNWSYTYTADQDDINEAQQNYEDKLYAIQELSDNYIKDMQSQVLDLLSAYEDEMAKINFSEEGWEQKAKEIEAFYQAKFNLLAQQFEGALGNQSDIYGEWEDYSALTGYGISANQDFIDSFDETTLSQLTGFQTMGEYQQVFTTNSQKLLTDLSGSFMDWRDHVQRIYEQAGKSTEDFAEKVGDMAEGVKEDNQSVVDSSESLKNEVIDNFEEAANGASAFADTWNEKIKTMTDSNNDLVESINDIIEAWARLNNAEEEKNNKQEQNEQEEKNDSSNNNNNNNNNKTLSENDSVSVKTSATHFATGQQMAGFVPGGSYSVMQVSGDRVLIGRNGVATGWVKKTDLVGFHSGGYTGEWGSSGKLAMLHEKELVLNANDTKNILTSVELMREISQAIDLNASMSAYSNAISAAMPNTGVITNQNIVINAEFPDATDRLEIQAAFDNLLNRASQYANRK